MRHGSGLILVLILFCFGALFLICYAPALFMDRQFGYRDAGNYYYSLNKRVQAEWNAGRWPLWEPEENAGMPLLGNPTAAVLYPGKLIFAIMPYAWAARTYILAHSALAFLAMLVLMRSWGTSWVGSGLSALSYAFGGPVLSQYCNIIFLIGAAWLPLGLHAVDQWLRLGRRWGVLELAIVLTMQVLGGEPQAAYLLGVASVGYAVGLAWNQSRLAMQEHARARPGFLRRTLGWLLIAIGLVAWFGVTLALAQWLPTTRDHGKPPPPLRWMPWVPLGVNVAWGVVALGTFFPWRWRGRRYSLGVMWVGLAGSAALAAMLAAAQLLPVIEFTQQTGRAITPPRETYQYSLDPVRLVELVWPNFLGGPIGRNDYWRDIIETPGGRPSLWVPSIYVGGLTLALALGSLTVRHGPPWRVWVSVLAGISLLGSLGEYTSPIWLARASSSPSSAATRWNWLPKLGPMDPYDSGAIRLDGYLRDSDGSVYWWLSTILPGFRQFRYPAKLFTLTALAMAALAGFGWDRLGARRARATAGLFFALLALTLLTLAVVVLKRAPILASFRGMTSASLFGPFEPLEAYRAIVRSLGQAAIVFGLGSVLILLARKRLRLAGSAALVLMTADLAAANARYILTVPQHLFETEPEALKVIEDAERADPSPGPFRIHRMPRWHPFRWGEVPSDDRITEIVSWERDTLHAKYGIDYGLEYTHAGGVAQLHDYDRFFAGFYTKILDKQVARQLDINVGDDVLYDPRRAYDLWNTRYMIIPIDPNGWRDSQRSFASFLFRSRQIYPDPASLVGPNSTEEARKWAGTRDFKVMRNLNEYPRSWIVHGARATVPVVDPSLRTPGETMLEILFAADPIWSQATRRVHDPHSLAWVSHADLTALRRYLSGLPTRSSETVKVTYPDPQQTILEANLDSPGIVILADVFYPGWELAVDGKPAPIYQVNGLMRGAAVSASRHRLVYTYNPGSVRLGRRVSIAGLVILVILGAAGARWPIDLVVAGNSSYQPTSSGPPMGEF